MSLCLTKQQEKEIDSIFPSLAKGFVSRRAGAGASEGRSDLR